MTRRSCAVLGTCLAALAIGCSGEIGDSAASNRYCTMAAGQHLGSDAPACFSVQNGRAIFDGDIDLGDAAEFMDDVATIEGGLEPQAISPSREAAFKLWTNGTIMYQISASFTSAQKQQINAAIAHFNSFSEITGVTWKAKTIYYAPNYVLFTPDTTSAFHGSSAIGRAGGLQYLYLNYNNMVLHNKNPVGTILHEMGHAAGLLHEQSREDRDLYVTIHPQNIDPAWGGQFEKLTGPLWDDIGPYNFSSVMHYAWDNGSIQYEVLPTITKKDGSLYESGTELGVMSQGDLDALEYLYRSVLNPSLPFYDSFSRPNDIILGPYWRNRTGKIDLANGKAANVAPSYWSIEQMGTSNYGTIKAEADLEVGEYGAYLVVRYKGPGDNNYYAAGINRAGAGGSPRISLRRKQNGTVYELAGQDTSATSGHFRLEASSNSLRLYMNNQLLFTRTDSSFYTGGVGIRLAGSAKLDNFSASN